ncbi:ANTR protein, partial [Baryphthengus martii]|nr:ANTR protein [Baryphthengus martii]
MKMKMCIGLVLAMVVTACQGRPAAEAPGAARNPPQLPASLVRRDWPQSLSQEQKHLLSQFLPHIFTAELSERKGYRDEGLEALHDHYYPDWMDFGRRSTEHVANAV